MGCGQSSSDNSGSGVPKEDRDRSFAIDKQIDEDARKLRRECKILLLG